MESSQPAKSHVEMALKMGLMLALVEILLSMVQYKFFMGTLSLTFVMTGISIVASLIVMIFVAVLARRAQGGYITLRQVFKPIFITILLGASLAYLFNLLYIHYLDPSVYDQMKQAAINFAADMGADGTALDEIATQFDREQAKAMTAGRIILGLFQTIILHSIGGIIIAAIFKKNAPPHAEPVAEV